MKPGVPDASRLALVLTGAAKPQMPPKGEEAPTAAEIELIQKWIAHGAKGSGVGGDTPSLTVPQIKLLAQPKLAINALAQSPDGKLLAIARYGEVELQSLPELKTIATLRGIRGSVNGVSFSADGQKLVAAAGEAGLFGEANVFSVAEITQKRSADDAAHMQPKAFRGHKDSLDCAEFSPDGNLLATGGYDSSIKLWNVATGEELRALMATMARCFNSRSVSTAACWPAPAATAR